VEAGGEKKFGKLKMGGRGGNLYSGHSVTGGKGGNLSPGMLGNVGAKSFLLPPHCTLSMLESDKMIKRDNKNKRTEAISVRKCIFWTQQC
jgi:hypothetical protein